MPLQCTSDIIVWETKIGREGLLFIYFGVKGITGLIEIYILSTNSMSVCGTFNQLRVCVTFYIRYKSTVKRSALEVDDGEVRPSLTYEQTKINRFEHFTYGRRSIVP